jgi:two-component system KDP operon response regulator KdpE
VPGRRILVVDDEASIRQLLEMELSAGGFDVLQAGGGESAVRLTSDERPDLLLVDYGLPDMDGDELIQRLRAVSAAPLVVISGYTDSDHKDAAMTAGATEYLTKPFDGEAILALCRSLLGMD